MPLSNFFPLTNEGGFFGLVAFAVSILAAAKPAIGSLLGSAFNFLFIHHIGEEVPTC